MQESGAGERIRHVHALHSLTSGALALLVSSVLLASCAATVAQGAGDSKVETGVGDGDALHGPGKPQPQPVDGLKYVINLLSQRQEQNASLPSINMTGKDGRRYRCSIPVEPNSAPADVQESVRPTYSSLLASLVGSCFLLRKGYWDYEVCPGKAVKQFHMEGNVPSPVFSLGRYDASLDMEWEGTYSQSFRGGTNDRRAVVTYRCSEGDSEHRVAAIEEPSPLQYQIDFVTPSMCAGTASKDKAPRSPQQLLEKLRSACLYRNEGWWTYEVCHGKHVMQFHQEGEKRISEYFLGRFNVEANVAFEQDESNLVRDPTNPYYFQLYDNGTMCEPLKTERRSVEVRFECNTMRQVNFIKSVEEVATCRYVVNVVSPLICAHEAFQSKEELIGHISCVPV